MDNKNLILILNAIRLELRNLNLTSIAANAINRGVSDNTLADAVVESRALRERSNSAANSALGRSPR